MSTPESTPSTPEPAPEAPSRTAAPLPDDADDLRGYHFHELLRKPLTWGLGGGGALALGLVFLLAFDAAGGVVVFLLALGAGTWVVWKIADSRAADDFFAVYARRRGLDLAGKTRLPAATPLLRKGDERYAERTLTGALAPGVEGCLALYTYVVESSDGNGNRDKSYYHYTVGLIEVPECADRLPELYCRHQGGPRSLERLEDVFRRSKERVRLESAALDDKYEIFVGKGEDATWLRRLFSPTFIVWLTEAAPAKFGFELVDGTLVAFVRGHQEDTADLDAVAAASGLVATRLREKSAG